MIREDNTEHRPKQMETVSGKLFVNLGFVMADSSSK